MATAAIAAAAVRAEREIIAHLRSHGATSPDRATDLPPLRRIGERRLRRLVDARVVWEAPAGYWLDETLYASYQADRRTMQVALFVALFGVLAAALLAAYFQRR